MNKHTQPALDFVDVRTDNQHAAREINEIISELCHQISEVGSLVASKEREPMLQSLAHLCDMFRPVLKFSAAAHSEMSQLHNQLHYTIEECDQQRIEISALQTKLQSKEKECRQLQREHQIMAEKLQSVMGSLDTTLGS